MRAPDFWQEDGLIPNLLTPLSWIWQLHAKARFWIAKPTKLDVPVICVGNAVVGGAGKTPVTISVAARSIALNLTPQILTRGYGRKLKGSVLVDPAEHNHKDVGDEPIILSHQAPTWVSEDRISAGQRAISSGANILIMDDGFQNPLIHKDFSILVVDGGYGFGNNRILPAGPLRESIRSAVDRADLIAVIGTGSRDIRATIGKDKPILTAQFVPKQQNIDICGERVVAFAGIGRPSKFFQTLSEIGCEVIETRSYPDHHVFTGRELAQILEIAKSKNAIPVTTEKDGIRLPQRVKEHVHILPVTLEWDDKEALDKMIATLIATKA